MAEGYRRPPFPASLLRGGDVDLAVDLPLADLVDRLRAATSVRRTTIGSPGRRLAFSVDGSGDHARMRVWSPYPYNLWGASTLEGQVIEAGGGFRIAGRFKTSRSALLLLVLSVAGLFSYVIESINGWHGTSVLGPFTTPLICFMYFFGRVFTLRREAQLVGFIVSVARSPQAPGP